MSTEPRSGQCDHILHGLKHSNDINVTLTANDREQELRREQESSGSSQNKKSSDDGVALAFGLLAAAVIGFFYLHDKYVVQPNKPKWEAAERERVSRQQAEDKAKNQQLALTEINQLNTPQGKEELVKAFKMVQQKRLKHHVIVSWSKDGANSPFETAVLLPPAEEISKTTSLMVCVSHYIYREGHPTLVSDSWYEPFSSSKLAFTTKVPYKTFDLPPIF